MLRSEVGEGRQNARRCCVAGRHCDRPASVMALCLAIMSLTFWTGVGAVAALVAALGAGCAAYFAWQAVQQEGRLLTAAQKQVEISQRQVEATFMPLVVFQPVVEPDGRAIVGVRNIGSGAALMILLGVQNLHVPIGVLGVQEDAKQTDRWVRDVLNSVQQPFRIRFESVSGEFYQTTGIVSRGAIMNRPPVRITNQIEIDRFEQDWQAAIAVATVVGQT